MRLDQAGVNISNMNVRMYGNLDACSLMQTEDEEEMRTER